MRIVLFLTFSLICLNSYCQLDSLRNLFLDLEIDTNYSTMIDQLENNSSLEQRDTWNYKLKGHIKDPVNKYIPDELIDSTFGAVFKTPDSVSVYLEITEMLTELQPDNIIYSLGINRYYADLKSVHCMYNLILEKLSAQFDIKPQLGYSLALSDGFLLNSTGLYYQFDNNKRNILGLMIYYLANDRYCLKLDYTLNKYK